MCKNPASECKPIEEENVEAEDDNAVSEDESEYTDSDESDLTESSAYSRRDSDSDAESATGNRVTPGMVLLLMLKEHGAITEEEYARKAEKCEDNIKPLIPMIPRSASLVSIDYTKIDDESNDGNFDNGSVEDALREGLSEEVIGDYKDTVDTTDRSELASHKNIDSVEKDESFEEVSSHKNIDSVEKDKSFEEVSSHKNIGSGEKDESVEKVSSHTNIDSVEKDESLEKVSSHKNIDSVKKDESFEEVSSHKNIDSGEKNESLEKETDVKGHSTSDLLEIGTLQGGASNANGSEVKSHTNTDLVTTDSLKITKTHERRNDAKENAICDWLLNNTNTNVDVEEQYNGEILIQQQGATVKVDRNESNEETQDLQQDQVLEASREESYKDQQETVKCESILSENFVDKTVTEGSDKGCGNNIASQCTSAENIVTIVENTETMHMEIDSDSLRNINDSTTANELENNLEENTAVVVENASVENNNNANQDTALIKTDKESKKDQNTKNELNTAGKITKSFEYIINKLVREKRIIEEDEEDRITDEYGESYAATLRSFVRWLDDQYGPDMTASKSVSDDEDDDDQDLREFALYLNFYSPSSYKYILETFNTPLPEHKVLCTWYMKDDHEPGLTERAFKILKQKSSEKRLTCSLMFIDIYLKNDGRYYDSVDYGAGPNDRCIDKAVFAYVFVLVSLDEDWKMPIGYLYVRNVPAETQAELIRVCLTQCHEAGADVVAVTLETLTPAEFLGCSFQDPTNLKTTFKHPVCDRDVAVWIEPCLALKSARQTLKVKGALIDDRGNRVRWNLIRKLIRLHSADTIDLEKPEFFELKTHIAKVGLTSEIFSKSLASALELSEKLLPDLFTDTEPTRRYILFINAVYCILNSRVPIITRRIMLFLYAAQKYLIRILRNEENGLSPYDRVNLAWGNERKGYRYFLRGEAACGFLGFLICIESFKHLYTTLVQKEKRITHLNPQRLCKGRAEDFVTTLRAHSCWDPEYFTGESFQRYYNKLFDALEKNPLVTDKSVPLEHWPLQDRYSPAETIKLTSGKRSYDDIYSAQYKLKKLRTTSDENRATKVVREYSKALDTEKDLSTRKNMVGYIAGWIAAKFARCLKCEPCINALCTDKKLWFHKFITLKRIYAVCLPSEEIFRICWECERALRLKRTPASLRAWVLRRLVSKFPWSSKVAEHPPGHYIQLARAVIAKYVPLRIPAPFSQKERTRIIDLFKRFTSKDANGSDSYEDEYDELAEWMESSSEEDDSDQLY